MTKSELYDIFVENGNCARIGRSYYKRKPGA